MYKTITITMKNGNYATWEKNEWDDYLISNNLFVVKKNEAWIGFYNLDCVKSIVVE